jgi:hypothetical protein
VLLPHPPLPDPPHLSSNGVPIPFTPDLFTPLRDSTELLGDPGGLRRRLLTDGSLLLRGVLDRAAVLRLRAAYFSLFGPGYLASGSTPEEGIFSGRVPPGVPEYGAVGHPAFDFVRTFTFHRFLAGPVLRELAGQLLGGEAEMLPRRVLRHYHRGAWRASRAHMDLDCMDGGSERVLTFWIPVGDCPPDTGGLVCLEGSHTLTPRAYAALRTAGDRPEDRSAISHDLELTARRLGRRWQWADYAAGDLVAHLPRAVHASLDTATDAMRLSIDTRFIRSGDRADPRWLQPWSPRR